MDAPPSQQFPQPLPAPHHPIHLDRLIAWCQNHWLTIVKVIALLVVTAALIWHIIWLVNHKKSTSSCTVNFVVRKDGRGDFATISAAVKAAPENSILSFCIFIREGEYRESIYVGPDKTNLVFIGDGIGKTTITSNLTQLSTLRVKGNGFTARGLTIANTGGPENCQAAALESSADLSVFYRCRFLGHGNTLNAFLGRQFYRSCQVEGTQYFIYGDAIAVFQKCIIKAVKLHPEDTNVISGQLRTIPVPKNGFVFHLCNFTISSPNLVSSAKTYLGCPLEAYSITVVMQSFLDASISGWLVDNSTTNTFFFGEYGNSGPGATTKTNSTSVRLIDASEASKFTVRAFLKGQNWMPSDVPYNPDLV